MSENEVILFDITEAAIAELKSRYTALSINGIDDKEGYASVRAARLDMKGYRVSVDKRRKELNEEALKHQRRINAEAKKITDQLTPIEDYLAKQEQEYDAHIEQIKREKEAIIAAKRQARIDRMIAVGFAFNGLRFTRSWSTESHGLEATQGLPDAIFEQFLISSEQEYLAHQEEKRLEQVAADELAAKQKAEAEEAQRIIAEQKAKQDAIDAAERARIAQEQEAENKRLAEQRAEQQERERVIAEKEAALKAEAEKLEAAKREAESKKVVVEPEKVCQAPLPELNYYEVNICGHFKARHTLQAKSSEQARAMSLNILHNLETDLYLEFEQTDIEATDVS